MLQPSSAVWSHPRAGLGSALADWGSGSKEAFQCDRGVSEDASCAVGHQVPGLASAGTLETFPGELGVIWILKTILPCTMCFASI